jgi:hypothetical protein
MRLRVPSDDHKLSEMLRAEGLEASDMAFADCPTVVLEKDGEAAGFFTLRMERGRPYVIHLCGDKETGWELVKGLKAMLKGIGARRAIINIPTVKQKLLRVARRALHAVPYAEQDGHTFLTMEVNHG